MILNQEAAQTKEMVSAIMQGREEALATIISYIPNSSNTAVNYGNTITVRSIYRIEEIVGFVEFQLDDLVGTNRKHCYAFHDKMEPLLTIMGKPIDLTSNSVVLFRHFVKIGWDILRVRAQEGELALQPNPEEETES